MEKASIDKILANAEIKTMINTFGCGFLRDMETTLISVKLRYDKIIIMADADVDGAHISTLYSPSSTVSCRNLSMKGMYIWLCRLC